MTDKRALKILFDTYWSSIGWKTTGWETTPKTPPDDFAYAKASGYMFDPVELSHDATIDWLFSSFEQVNLEEVIKAFLASLSSRRLHLRSALGSYAIARKFPRHSFTGENRCEVCGLYNSTENEKDDLNVLNFERYKWGGVRHLDPLYIAFDLKLFKTVEIAEPTDDDRKILKEIVRTARNLNSEARVRDLEKALAPVIKSNQAEREVLIQILSYCGILHPKEHPGFFHSFIKDSDRTLPPVSKIDWNYPACWWRGKDGINDDALKYYFGSHSNVSDALTQTL